MRRDRDVGAAGGLGVLSVRRDRGGAPPQGLLLDHRPAASPGPQGIESIPADGWTPIKYTNAIWDEDSQRWISDAEVAEIAFTAFTSKAKAKQVTARLIVRRVPDVNPANQSALFTVYRYHAVFTNSPLPMLKAEKAHRAHAIVEQVIADQERTLGSFALRIVCREQRLVGLRRDGLQPHPAPPVSSPRCSTPKPPPAPTERS